MAKKGKKDKEAKKARAEQKLKKNLGKAELKDKKKAKKVFGDDDDEDDLDLEEVLANFKKEQELYEKIVVEPVERPSVRINPCLIANPVHGKKELILFGGENTNQATSTTHFYNELFTYTPENDQWKKITSQNAPMPRSSAAMAAHPSGIAILHGGEFSSPKQNTFYHYSDTWLLDCATKEWAKLDQKNGPASRSGHRITIWKNFFILYGGFRDLGTSTTYLNDCWLFDITTHRWTQVEFPRNHPLPDARSGHSFIPDQEGAILWGGYCKVKAGKGLQKGKILSDCWSLKMNNSPTAVRWERRKRQGFQPSPRVGCSMVSHKGRGVMFGGVYDFEETEESLDSNFYNDLFSYQINTNRWYSISLRPQRKKQVKVSKSSAKDQEKELQNLLNQILQRAQLYDQEENNEDDRAIDEEFKDFQNEDNEDEKLESQYSSRNQLPHPRFNASLAVVNDTLFIYGGIWEMGEKDYTIDSFYSIDLNKADGVIAYWENLSDVEKAKQFAAQGSEEEDEEESGDEEEDEDAEFGNEVLVAEEEDFEEDEMQEEEEGEEMEIPDPRPWLPHPKAFESLRTFYIRTGPQFLEWAISNNRDAKGKHLKKNSFDLCQDRWWERRDQVRFEEDKLEEMGGVGDVIEKDLAQKTKRR
ncbi:related to Kelch repeat-containing protein 3 [Zygosaccharomyces bailii]|nr:related to Kelch repeat-containing protein 3 [Zygosaccharomyces bailii]